MHRIIHLFVLAVMMAGAFLSTASAPAQAQESQPAEAAAASTLPPFQLPFAQPPGPDTWLLAQPYGNTTGAFRQRFTTYGASGGIHFGVDLSAPCGTELVAMADGVVFAVDGPFGSPPHNLMIDHPQLGYASMYGHLLEAPALKPGQAVKQGQVIALSGDSGETCYYRPHLHLEIRDLSHVTKYNPLPLIQANWQNLALISAAVRDFARDLEEPRKWQALYDQPQASTGGPIVNDFAYPWPFDWRDPNPGNLLPPAARLAPAPALAAEAIALDTWPYGRQLTTGECCTQPFWSQDSTQIRFIDQPNAAAPVGLWAVNVAQPEAGPEFVSGQLGIYSPDGAYLAYPGSGGQAIVRRLADGEEWVIDTQNQSLTFSPDSRHVLWTVSPEDSFNDERPQTVWVANVDGSEPRALLQSSRINTSWLSNTELLLTRRIPGGADVRLFRLNIATGRQSEVGQSPQMRGLAFSPDRRYLAYYVSFQPDTAQNGLWLLDLQQSDPQPQKLPFFGSYRWRDNQRLLYIPFDPAAAEHNFYEYNVLTGQSRPLFPGGTGLTVANNDWRVSPDGRSLALVADKAGALDGIWLLYLPPLPD